LVGRRATLLIFIIVILSVSSSGFCIDTIVGVKGGGGHFSYMGDDYQDFLESNNMSSDLKLGFAIGAFVTIELADYFAVQPEVLLLMAGDAYRGDASDWDPVLAGPYYGEVKYIDQYLYAVIPLLIKTGFWRLRIFAGPTLLLRLGDGKMRLRADDELLQHHFELTGLDSLEYVDGVFARKAYAATAGLGFEFPAGRRGGVFLLEGRGQYVFTNVLDESWGPEFQAYGVLLMLGYGLGSGGRQQIRSKIR
jgi:hypothetical protein